jgi:Rrf2 family iron-sulfur cluster assembly transcriptional regulator
MNSLLRVSARNHLGLILMADLASAEDWITLQSVAERMRLSQGYLEEVANGLKQAGLIEGRKGPGGGYRLAKPAKDITIEAILVALEGPVAMVECQSMASGCPVANRCSSKSIWDFLQRDVVQTLKRTTLADV